MRWSWSRRWPWSSATTGARSWRCCPPSRSPIRPTSSRTWSTILAGQHLPPRRGVRPARGDGRAGRGADPGERRGAARGGRRARPGPTSRRWSRRWPSAWRPPASGCARASASSPACWRRRTPPEPGDARAARARGAGRGRAALRRLSGARPAAHRVPRMSTATLPDVLSEPARSFAAGPHRLLIGGERPDVGRRAYVRHGRPVHGRTIAAVAHAGARGRGPRRPRRPRGLRRRPLERHRGRGAHAGHAGARRRDRGERRRARRAGVARQRQAGEAGQARGRRARRRAPALLRRLADEDRRRHAAGRPAEHALLHAQGAGRRVRRRSSRGTSRC